MMNQNSFPKIRDPHPASSTVMYDEDGHVKNEFLRILECLMYPEAKFFQYQSMDYILAISSLLCVNVSTFFCL